MHELAIMQSITEVALAQMRSHGASRVLGIWIDAGEMRNLEETWVNRYFLQCAAGTPAEGARIHVRRVPVEFRCTECSGDIPFELHVHHRHCLICPHCGSQSYELAQGDELAITGLQIA